MVNKKKQELVHKLAGEIKNSPIIGVADLESLPSQQLQVMKGALRRKGVTLVMTRKRLLAKALEASGKQNMPDLVNRMKGVPALILTKENPFALYKFIQKNKSEAAAKPGQIAPRDLMVKAGPTNFAPGPIISELAAVGIKTKVEAGKLSVIQDTIIVKEGAVISQKVSETLKRLDIKPMEIGLDLVAVWENGLVFDAKQLHIDEAEYAQNITQAATWAMNLAIEVAYPTEETTELLLQKAFNDAKALSIEQNFITTITAGDIVAKAERQALALKEQVPD